MAAILHRDADGSVWDVNPDGKTSYNGEMVTYRELETILQAAGKKGHRIRAAPGAAACNDAIPCNDRTPAPSRDPVPAALAAIHQDVLEPLRPLLEDLQRRRPDLTPDEWTALVWLERPAGRPPREVWDLWQAFEGLTAEPDPAPVPETVAEPDPAPVPETPWSLVPLERVDDMAIEDLWALIDWLQKEFEVKPPRGADMLALPDLQAWVREQVRSDGVHRRWLEIERRKEADRIAKLRRIGVSDMRVRDLTDMALTAVVQANSPPMVFVRSGALTRITYDEKGTPSIRFMTEAMVTHLLERCADFYKYRNIGTRAKPEWEEVPVPPPERVVTDFMQLYDWPLPPLQGIVEAPLILRDDTLVTEPGYNPATQLYYAPAPGLVLAPVPARPSKADLQNAVDLLEEVFCDFPFDGEASKTNCLAALLTAVLRPLFPGNAPMALFDKPQAGTGATLAAEVIALVATGRPAAMMTAPTTEEEWKKTITAILFQGRSIVVVDNIKGVLDSDALNSVLTSDVWEDRILGRTEMISTPARAVWIGTGNNIPLGGDMPRRCYRIRLDARVARPYQRTGFKHPEIKRWVLENRGRILAAILTLARAWVQAGCPKPKGIPVVGGFEGWRDTIGGILVHAGRSKFLANLQEMYEETDIDTPQWERFLERWHAIWKDRPVILADVYQHLLNEASSVRVEFAEEVRLLDVLPDELLDAWEAKKKSFTKALGKALSSKNKVMFPNGLTVVKGTEDKTRKVVQWQVVACDP
ncbi:MAG: hypothetical protein QMC96_12165 [Methanomicrobiales archaeon]|nr:hypothetical protein [Methanomicrobiales archaeon]